MSRSYLVTGGAGFIGSHLTDRLLREGHRVVVLDDFDDFYDPSVKEGNVEPLADFPLFRLVRGDIRDGAAVERAFSDESFDAVIHLAARAGVRPSIEDPVLYSSVNLDGTTRLLEAARRRGVARFVFGSSSSVYGDNPKVPFAEDDPVDHPISPYAATKRSGELIAHTYAHVFGLHVACLRFFTVFGPRQRPDLAIHKFAVRMIEGREIEQFGDGTTARDYTYVDDIVEGILLATEKIEGFRIWNLGGSRPLPLSEMIAKIAAALGVEPRIRRLPRQPGDVERTWADLARVERELGWLPRTDFDSGLARFVAWLREPRGGRTSTETS